MTQLYVSLLAFTALSSLIPQQVGAVDVTVSLNYSTYIGTAQAGTGVTQWLGIRYAEPPLGDLRFMPPQDPVVNTTAQLADQVGNSALTISFSSHTDKYFSMANIAWPPTVRPTTQLHQKTASSSTCMHLRTPLRAQTCQCTFSSKAAASTSTAIPT